MRTIAIAVAGSIAILVAGIGLLSSRSAPDASAATEPAIQTGPASTARAASTESTQLDDATIVAIFDAANTFDIETGQLAVERGASADVRQFGAELVAAHQQVRQQGRDLARRLGVTPTPPTDDSAARAHEAAMRRLRALEGGEFDRAFLRHEIEFHEAVIEAVQTTLLPAIENPELRSLVENVAPAFVAHLRRAQQLEGRIAATAARQ